MSTSTGAGAEQGPGGDGRPPVVLVAGFWLGAWAWDEVAALLREDGLEVHAVTLPGLGSVEEDRVDVHLADHVDAVVAAVRAAGRPVVLAVHSGAGVPGYAATDRVPELVAAAVYVDSGPGTGALDPSFDGVELPLPAWDALVEDGNSIDGLTPEHLDRFRARAVPQPGGAIREAPQLADDARRDVPTVVMCTSYSSEQVREAVAAGYAWVGGLSELRDVTWVDVPTGHWPMWSRPRETAEVIAAAATMAAERDAAP
ncbi:alpha/beta fold hydrolase [Cellulomonas oligotrophica]|uniref:Esterase n=1 Tax=Cellulomonas oligotrophica TaxID=931536 RepID=A0A7Y9FHL4_9CELL|nr:alpha/beta hydrolase [Cellulomonas oligotrophica]NYD87067.1 pimeloyl-ACP methyl ester carboxylesterase [Cellulomonas oligotrophica]GIG32147.1 esterase [Cellulomonas oligotrophica]